LVVVIIQIRVYPYLTST